MENKLPYTKEQLDYLTEIFNIASANAVTAFSQLMNTDIEIKETELLWLPDQEVAMFGFKGKEKEATSILMNMVGDVLGSISFIVSNEDSKDIVKIAEKTMMGEAFSESKELSLSVLTEIGNILAGAYLNAIFNFSGLRIYHSIPSIEIASIQALLVGLMERTKDNSHLLIVVHSKFVLRDRQIPTCFFLCCPEKYVAIFINSVKTTLSRMDK